VKMVQPWSVSEIVDGILEFSKWTIKENIPEKKFSRDEAVERIEELY
jgi:hypothetical protein